MPKYKRVKIHADTHQALLMYCIVNQLKMQDMADKWITERLLKEAGVNGSTD